MVINWHTGSVYPFPADWFSGYIQYTKPKANCWIQILYTKQSEKIMSKTVHIWQIGDELEWLKQV